MLSTSTELPRLACCWSPAPIMAAPLLAWCRNTIEHPVSAAMASMRPMTWAMGPLAFSSSMWNRRSVSSTIRRRPGGALEAVEPLRGHDVGQAADQRLDQQAVSHGLPFLGAEVRPKGVQAVMNGGGRVFGGQVDHRAGGQFAHLQQIRPACNLCGQLQGQHGFTCTVAKLAMRQPFVLFKGLTFQKLCLPGAFRPGDHHNKMLRPGLCVVHASPQYL